MSRLAAWCGAALAALAIGGCSGAGFEQSDARADAIADRGALPSTSQQVAARGGLVATDPWESPEACALALSSEAERTPRVSYRVATWNLRWFPRGTMLGSSSTQPTNVDWMACIIASMDVDVVAIQEVLGTGEAKGALVDLIRGVRALTGHLWLYSLDDCTAESLQHVGFLYDATRLSARDQVRVDWSFARACDFGARSAWASGFEERATGQSFSLASVHLKSGVDKASYEERRQTMAELGRVRAELKDSDAIVLGDFNSMGCSRRTCSDPIDFWSEVSSIGREARAQGMTRVFSDVAVTETGRFGDKFLDHVIASRSVLARTSGAKVQGICRRAEAERPSAPEDALSDHCPVVLEWTPEAAP